MHPTGYLTGGAHYGTFQMFGPGARDGVNDKMKAHFLKLLEAGGRQRGVCYPGVFRG